MRLAFRFSTPALFLAAFFSSSCKKAPTPAAPVASPAEARYPADLGGIHIDVSAYPAEQQEIYPLFTQKCAACHTLARAVNAPWSDAEKWALYLERRRVQSGPDGKPWISENETRALVSFLIFDSQKRKVEGNAAFKKEQDRLKLRFTKVLEERALKSSGAATTP